MDGVSEGGLYAPSIPRVLAGCKSAPSPVVTPGPGCPPPPPFLSASLSQPITFLTFLHTDWSTLSCICCSQHQAVGTSRVHAWG